MHAIGSQSELMLSLLHSSARELDYAAASVVEQPHCLLFDSFVRFTVFISTHKSAGKPYTVVYEKSRFLDRKDSVNHYMNIAFKLVATFAIFAEVVFLCCLGGSGR